MGKSVDIPRLRNDSLDLDSENTSQSWNYYPNIVSIYQCEVQIKLYIQVNLFSFKMVITKASMMSATKNTNVKSVAKWSQTIANNRFCTKLGPSPSWELPNSVWMTEIGQSVFKLCKLKEKVGRWFGRSGTYKFVLLQALSLTTLLWLFQQKVIRVAHDMLTWNTFSLSLTVLERGAEICPYGRQTSTIRGL